MGETVKYLLPEERLPRAWYNLVADLPARPPPSLHPATGACLTADDLAPLFPASLIEQDASTERDIEIPEPVRDGVNRPVGDGLHRWACDAGDWLAYEFDVPAGGVNGRVLNLVSEDPVEHIVRVVCSFTAGGKNYSVEVLAKAAVMPGADPGEPALNSATFWFGPDGPEKPPEGEIPGPSEDLLCGEGVLGDHTTWVDERP